MVFRCWGCRLKIEFSFVLMLAVSLLTGSDRLLYVLLFAGLHEAGHIVALLIFGGKPDCITLAFYGVGLKHHAVLKRWQEWLFLLAGISVNAVFAALRIYPDINGPLLLINAMPVYPLDMGRALSLYLPYRFCRVLSVVILIALATAAILLHNWSIGMIAAYLFVFSLKEDL